MTREILAFLEEHAAQVLIQQIPVGRRRKNRCILQLNDGRVVGGATIAAAVQRARLRIEAAAIARTA